MCRSSFAASPVSAAVACRQLGFDTGVLMAASTRYSTAASGFYVDVGATGSTLGTGGRVLFGPCAGNGA